jgi:hypothetical protein
MMAHSHKMRKDMELATILLYKMKSKLNSLLPFMVELEDILTELEETGEERYLTTSLL